MELAWHGGNHSPDNIYIHFPGHDTLMLVDIVLPGWVPFYGINLSEDVPGYIAPPAAALDYPERHLIAGLPGPAAHPQRCRRAPALRLVGPRLTRCSR